ncbi:MAG: CARDB domain-containing protein, partial [Thermoleophilaceae bacterium]
MESVHGRYALRRWGSAAAALLPLLVCLILPALAFGRARADLQVSALAGGHAESGLHLRATVRNSGGAASRRSTVGFWLSSDGRRDRGDVRLGGSALKALRPGRSVHVSKSVRLPAAMPAGARLVLACADELSRVRESRESNNCRTTRISLPAATRVPLVSNPPAPLPFAPLPPAPAVPGPAPAAAAVSLSAPVDGAYIATATPALTGTGSTSSFVTVYIRRAGALVATLTTLPADGGSWSLSPPV